MFSYVRFVLFPFSLLYKLVTTIRNSLYNVGILESKSYDVHTISVGNLSVGGSGKTPHCEYIINLLKEKQNVVLLSRGYKRITKGFVLADEHSTTYDIGDEPMQLYQKFKHDIEVCVCEKRTIGIEKIMSLFPDTDVIILDDAFQHRAVTPRLNILLMTHSGVQKGDYVLPMGNLRESKRGSKRANIIVVTKCPPDISESEMGGIRKKLNIGYNQELFFSTIKYGHHLVGDSGILPIKEIKDKVLLVTGIANPHPLKQFLSQRGVQYEHMRFSDHYHFKNTDVNNIAKKSQAMSGSIILTTEKDFMRFQDKPTKLENIFYIPISIDIVKEKDIFDKTIIFSDFTKFLAFKRI